jgi:hypothetical protein
MYCAIFGLPKININLAYPNYLGKQMMNKLFTLYGKFDENLGNLVIEFCGLCECLLGYEVLKREPY